ncbi:uncharacterized protein V1513DRAFT_455583 [Lipomyces chichibuensis]|uniref:uncharacterized protein n=1 Tax=Lipomyces chichibuensis TaxID=1546026 RepID=UPI0033432749
MTFEEFIACCHTFLSEPLKIEPDRNRTTKGSLTNAAGRLCPTYLRPWTDFHSLQKGVFDSVHRFLQPPGEIPSRLLPSHGFLKDLGDTVCRLLASEADLGFYERSAVEDQVYKAIIALRSIPAAHEKFSLPDEIIFYNNLSAFESDSRDSAVDALKQKRSVGDQFCVSRVENGAGTLLYTIEYKPAHKLSAEYLRSGLREMNFWEDVVQRVNIPTDQDEKFRYDAERLTGAAVAQVYNGMIHDGLAHACLTNGYCKVFFHVSEGHPEILYYFLSEPKEDVRNANDKNWFQQPITAVGRMLSFTLMSIGCMPRSQTWRTVAMSRLHRWQIDSEQCLRQMSATETQSAPTGSEYNSSSSSSVSSAPIESRQYELRSRHRCLADDAPSRTSADSSESDSNDASAGPGNASGRKRSLSRLSSSSDNERARGSKSREAHGRGEHRSHASWQYCTQGCLMGLRNKGYLDFCCPNERRHRRGEKTDRHLIDSADLVRLIKQQLDKDLDNYCTPLGKVGIRGALFKLTLFSYGYTFVGKGTTDRLWTEVRTEVEVYRALQKAQGSAVPVFLGAIDLKMTYFLQGGACIKHMLLMSWGGEQANVVKDEAELWQEIRRSEREIRQLGVQHGDLHDSNILWNSQLGRVQIIDFHRSKLVSPQIRKLKTRLANV